MNIKKEQSASSSLQVLCHQNGDKCMADIPNLLNIAEVCEALGIKKSTAYNWMDDRGFPQPIKLSPTCARWREDEVADWISAKDGNEKQSLAKQETPCSKVTVPMPARTVDAETLQAQVRLAIENAGGVTVLACALGIKHPAIYSWTRIPAERVLEVEALTGIPCCELRPDIYPPDRFPPLPTEMP